MRKIIASVIIICVLLVAWYLLSPLFIVKELHEAVPLAQENTRNIAITQASRTSQNSSAARVPVANEDNKSSTSLGPSADSTISTPKKTRLGLFQPSAHDVAGKAMIVSTASGQVLRFEDFNSINGPDLRVYLSTGLDVKDAIDLGELKATKGSFNYALKEDIDTKKYNNVLVWCRAFGVLFSYAILPVE